MDWIDTVHHMDWWRALVNTVINLQVPLKAGNFLVRYSPVCHRELYSMELVGNRHGLEL